MSFRVNCGQAKAKSTTEGLVKLKRKLKREYIAACCLLLAFAAWTVLVLAVDVRAIGPQGSSVGFAAINGGFHRLTGVHLALYRLTDWLSLIPVGVIGGFGLLGALQLLRRRSILKVDRSLLLLGGFYFAVMAVYLFFEAAALNFRPVLTEGVLEASYPSSTTLLVLTVMPTAAMQLQSRMKNKMLCRFVTTAIHLYTCFMVTCRLLSGVHWLTDIVGGILISAGLVALYRAVTKEK